LDCDCVVCEGISAVEGRRTLTLFGLGIASDLGMVVVLWCSDAISMFYKIRGRWNTPSTTTEEDELLPVQQQRKMKYSQYNNRGR
jgi:hypothetical protein